jgi:hypothetical protein
MKAQNIYYHMYKMEIHSIRSLEEKRLLAFLAERILNILYVHSTHFFGKIKIQPVKYRTIL